MCRPVREKAIAQWAELRKDDASRELAFWRQGPVTGNDKKYRPGVK
jgi:hypothetical protein